MNKQIIENRRILSCVHRNDGSMLKIELYGAGGTCVCYKISSDGEDKGKILKEFSPLDGYLYPLDRNSKEYKLRKENFRRMILSINRIGEAYEKTGATQLLKYSKREYEEGEFYICDIPINGETVGHHFVKQRANVVDDQINDLFIITIKTLLDLQKYHEEGLLNLDIKPSNLFYLFIDSDHDYIVRNLDYGSIMGIEDILYSLNAMCGGLSDLRHIQDEIIKLSTTFASTLKYYDSTDAHKVLRNCYNALKNNENEKAKAYLRRLDLKAVLIMFFERLFEILNISNESFKNLKEQNKLKYLCDKITCSNAKFKITENSLGGDGNSLVRYAFCKMLADLYEQTEGLCDGYWDKEITTSSLLTDIEDLYGFFINEESNFKVNLAQFSATEFFEIKNEDLFDCKGFGKPIGDLLISLLFEE